MADSDANTGMDDAQLLAEVAARSRGPDAAVNQLYDRYRRPCMRFFISRGVSATDAEDVFQETMMRVARSARSFDGRGAASAWIWQIARNCHSDQLRRQQEINEREEGTEDLESAATSHGFPVYEPLLRQGGTAELLPQDPAALLKELEKFKSAVPEESVPLADVYAQHAVQNCVRAGVRRFRGEESEQRYLALLLQVHGWSIEEIGSVLNRTASATKVFLFECRKKIAPFLTQCWELSRG